MRGREPCTGGTEAEALKWCVQLSCLVLSRGVSEHTGMSWVWSLAIVTQFSSEKPSFQAVISQSSSVRRTWACGLTYSE